MWLGSDHLLTCILYIKVCSVCLVHWTHIIKDKISLSFSSVRLYCTRISFLVPIKHKVQLILWCHLLGTTMPISCTVKPMLMVKALNYVPEYVLKNFVTKQHQLNRLFTCSRALCGGRWSNYTVPCVSMSPTEQCMGPRANKICFKIVQNIWRHQLFLVTAEILRTVELL